MIKVLFICHGNICRSPLASSFFQELVNKNNTQNLFFTDSAATSREEIGNPIYPPMLRLAKNENLPLLNHRARQVTKADVDGFDYLIVMDYNNKHNLLRAFPEAEAKVHLLTAFSGKEVEIEDPWWTQNYSKVFNQIKDSTLNFYNHLNN
ncbi:MAG: low molecular weight phosphotyrosine protein phosphatase [Spirochaetales bacterium]|nr:low molecular weight phosphotyrosine protein phosphatase [Spirochaetales bacterium]